MLGNGTSVLLHKPLALRNTWAVLKLIPTCCHVAVALKVHLGVSYDAQNKHRLLDSANW